MIQDPVMVELKPIDFWPGVWQAKINREYRALAMKEGSVFVWYWIGPREELNQFKSFQPPGTMTLPQRTFTGMQQPLRGYA